MTIALQLARFARDASQYSVQTADERTEPNARESAIG
jgi:hypothetical protein